MIRIVHVVATLAVIAVPAFGWFAEDWSGATTLVVYWCETVVACLFIAARVILHQHWTPRRGHFRYQAPSASRRHSQSSSFLTGFVVTSFAFCAAHAVFLWAVFFIVNRDGGHETAVITWRSVAFGVLSVSLFLALDFVADLLSLRRWSFWQVEQLALRGLSRVIVVHLTLIVGFIGIAIADAPTALFGVFVVLKSLAALSTAIPQWEPTTAPKTLSRVMNRVPSRSRSPLPDGQRGQSFEEAWAHDRAEESARREKNEQAWAG